MQNRQETKLDNINLVVHYKNRKGNPEENAYAYEINHETGVRQSPQ